MLLAGLAWAIVVGWLLARVLRQERAFEKQVLAPSPRPRPAPWLAPTVAVIVPARNEGLNIVSCLDALGQQDYPASRTSITVIDDGSTDGTAAEVLRFAELAAVQVSLIDAGPLPQGWLGKPHACWLGASRASAEWLCFIDADVRAAPALLACAVTAAEADGIDLPSVHPFQELCSFWERLVIPAGMLMVACAKPSQPQRGAEAGVNGQFLLVRAAAYQHAGGHAAVRGAVCEDSELARRLQAEGYGVRVMAGEHLARTRMYRDLGSLWEGFAKNAVDITGSERATITAACAGVCVAWAAPLLPLWLGVVALAHGTGASIAAFAIATLASGVVFGVHAGTLRHFRLSVSLLPLLPVGVTVASALAIESVRLRRAGRVRWKGRSYDLAGLSQNGR